MRTMPTTVYRVRSPRVSATRLASSRSSAHRASTANRCADLPVTLAQLRVLALIDDTTISTGGSKAGPTYKELVALSGFCIGTIQKHVKALTIKGLLTVIKGERRAMWLTEKGQQACRRHRETLETDTLIADHSEARS